MYCYTITCISELKPTSLSMIAFPLKMILLLRIATQTPAELLMYRSRQLAPWLDWVDTCYYNITGCPRRSCTKPPSNFCSGIVPTLIGWPLLSIPHMKKLSLLKEHDIRWRWQLLEPVIRGVCPCDHGDFICNFKNDNHCSVFEP